MLDKNKLKKVLEMMNQRSSTKMPAMKPVLEIIDMVMDEKMLTGVWLLVLVRLQKQKCSASITKCMVAVRKIGKNTGKRHLSEVFISRKVTIIVMIIQWYQCFQAG